MGRAYPSTSEANGRGAGVKVKDAMTDQVLTITPGRSLRDAARVLTDHNGGAAVIIDPEQRGPGIIPERALVRSLAGGEAPDRERVMDPLTADAAFADCEW